MKKLVYILAVSLLANNIYASKDTIDLNLLVLKGKTSQVFAHNKSNLSSTSSSDRLRNQEGLYLKEGNGKMLSSLRVNGTSPAQTVALWHGLNINNAFNGQVDVNLLPNHLLNFAFVNSGSAVSGNSSMAGALLMENSQIDSGFVIQSSIGSFGTFNQTILQNYHTKKGKIYSGIQYHQSKNNYKYSLPNGSTAELENAEAKIFHAILGTQQSINSYWGLSANIWLTHANRQIPSNIYARNDSANQKDESWRAQIGLDYHKGRHSFILSNSMSIDNLKFQSPLAQINSFYKSAQGNAEATYRNALNTKNSIYSSIFIQRQEAISYPVSSTALQNLGSKIGWVHKSNGSYLASNLSLNHYNQGYLPFNYEVLIKKKWGNWSAKIIQNTSFRAPTLNDLYWPNGGNLDLKPEKGTKLQALLNKKLLGKNRKDWFFAELGLQLSEYSNQIIWLPNSLTGIWSPNNISNTFHTNGSLSLKAYKKIKQIEIYSNLNSNYLLANELGWFESSNQLAFAPRITLNFSNKIKFKQHSLSLTTNVQSATFTSTENTEWVDGFITFNTRYQYQTKQNQLSGFVSINNITNQNYAFSLNRPMPGINFETGITLKI